MNNKAAIEISIGTVVIIVLAMSMLILGLVLVRSIFYEPHFKIIKEECWNETIQRDFNETLESMKYYEIIYSDARKVYNLCRDKAGEKNCSTLRPRAEEVTDKWNSGEYLFNAMYETKEVCEQVEVDEIKVPDKGGTRDCECLEYTTCEEVFRKCPNRTIYGNFPCKEYGKCNYHQFKTVPKQDLTIEWLEENAKCLKVCVRGDCVEDDDIYVQSILRDLKGASCFRWSLGDYTIETWEQWK